MCSLIIQVSAELLQMDLHDVLLHTLLYTDVHARCEKSSVERWVTSLSHSASTFVELSWQHTATI